MSNINFVGGGIIICELYPNIYNNKIYPAIVLGKEMYGNEKYKYADFGGGKNKQDKNNIYKTILREVLEESYINLNSLEYIKTLPQINIPINKSIKNPKYYKIVIKRIDGLDNNKFQQIRKKYISTINQKYSPWIEMGEIRHFFIHDIYYSLINNLSKVKDSNGQYCYFRKRLWNILKHTNILQYIFNNINIL